MATKRPSREDAQRWLRDYHGSIDSTALMLAHEAGQRDVLNELERLRRLHEVATERTVELAAVIERIKSFRLDRYLPEPLARDVHAALATADTSAVLRERDAEKWEEGNAENYRPATGPNPRNPYRQHEGGDDR